MKPRTRLNKFLAKIAGVYDGDLAPRTETEYYLDQIAEGGGGGGDNAVLRSATEIGGIGWVDGPARVVWSDENMLTASEVEVSPAFLQFAAGDEIQIGVEINGVYKVFACTAYYHELENAPFIRAGLDISDEVSVDLVIVYHDEDDKNTIISMIDSQEDIETISVSISDPGTIHRIDPSVLPPQPEVPVPTSADAGCSIVVDDMGNYVLNMIQPPSVPTLPWPSANNSGRFLMSKQQSDEFGNVFCFYTLEQIRYVIVANDSVSSLLRLTETYNDIQSYMASGAMVMLRRNNGYGVVLNAYEDSGSYYVLAMMDGKIRTFMTTSPGHTNSLLLQPLE